MRDHSLWQSVLFGLTVFGCVWALCKAFWCKCYRKIWHNWFDCSLPFFPTFIDSSNATKTHCRRWSEKKKTGTWTTLGGHQQAESQERKETKSARMLAKGDRFFIVKRWVENLDEIANTSENKQTNIARVRVSVGRAPKGNSSSRCFRCYVSFNLFSTAWVPSVFFSQLLDLVGCHQCWRQVILIFLICQAWMWR